MAAIVHNRRQISRSERTANEQQTGIHPSEARELGLNRVEAEIRDRNGLPKTEFSELHCGYLQLMEASSYHLREFRYTWIHQVVVTTKELGFYGITDKMLSTRNEQIVGPTAKSNYLGTKDGDVMITL